MDSGARPTRPPLPPRGDALLRWPALPLLPTPAPPLMPPAPRAGEDGRDDGPAPQADVLLRPPLKICNGHIRDFTRDGRRAARKLVGTKQQPGRAAYGRTELVVC